MYVVPCFNPGKQNWILIVSQQENLATYESKLCKQLYAFYSQAIVDTWDGGDGDDGEGAGTGAT